MTFTAEGIYIKEIKHNSVYINGSLIRLIHKSFYKPTRGISLLPVGLDSTIRPSSDTCQ